MLVSKKVLALGFTLVILSSVLVCWFTLPSQATIYKEYMALGVEVSPSGSSFKLGVNESRTFSTAALNGSGSYEYTWNICPSGNFTLQVNGVNQEVTNASSLSISGETLTLCYPVASEEFVSVNVVVKDLKMLISGSLLQPFVVADPYTSPGYKFDASTATASYIITADGLGWYRAVKGEDSSISWSSTDDGTIFTNVFATNPPSVYVKSGAYSAVLAVPAGTYLQAENATTGISYASIGNGAKINEPTFNAQYGGYSSGVFTISTNTTNFLAFKPDNTIYYFTTNQSYAIQSSIDVITSGAIGGEIALNLQNSLLTAPIILPASPPIYLHGNGMTATTLIYTGAGTPIQIGDNVNPALFHRIEDLSILTNGASNAAIYAYGWQTGSLKNVRIIPNSGSFAFGVILDYAASNVTRNSHTITFEHCYIQNIVGSGIYFNNAANDNVVRDCVFSGISGVGNYALILSPDSAGNKIVENHFDANVNNIYIYSAANYVAGNTMEVTTTTDVLLHGVSSNNFVVYNTVVNATTTILDNGAGNTVADNKP